MPVINVAKHCKNVLKYLNGTGAFYIKGADTSIHPDSDSELRFYQDSNMLYISGVAEPGFSFVYDINNHKSILFAPYISPDEAVWIGSQPSHDEIKQTYGVDQVHSMTDFETVIKSINPQTLYRIDYQSDAQVSALNLNINSESLLKAIHEARIYKEPEEIAILQKASDISSRAHALLMKNNYVGQNECNVHADFVGSIMNQGSNREAYTTIVGRGRNASTLHYIRNDSPIEDPTDLVLVDAGASYKGYSADITRTWPAGKTFTKEAKEIYQIVLDMQTAVLDASKPHVQWEDMHMLAMKVAAQGLLKLGILKGSLDEVMDSYIVGYFFPHGLGHFLGIDTHDCAGYPEGVPRINKPSIRYLRVRREMLPGMVFTVEPGLYFVHDLIEEARNTPELAKYVDFDVVQKYFKVGGVRIEDNIVITEDGILNLTTAPKTVEDLEKIKNSE
ncbi:hypothetical protein BB559_005505 [Furculomyces boomerangus]|uniref:Aminopeptidase P N-terminal domain-containing protein n=1 Tax=Furculomyces boomerangus TaxID=61424 RepID=A0A2T9Y741_9FUNG|nr:hypothetical protein BB559_005705 [Furculomyces boomerangus]PVU88596.1 hypothetical protein BB559_005505 [Furculomyces boomerangus]